MHPANKVCRLRLNAAHYVIIRAQILERPAKTCYNKINTSKCNNMRPPKQKATPHHSHRGIILDYFLNENFRERVCVCECLGGGRIMQNANCVLISNSTPTHNTYLRVMYACRSRNGRKRPRIESADGAHHSRWWGRPWGCIHACASCAARALGRFHRRFSPGITWKSLLSPNAHLVHGCATH